MIGGGILDSERERERDGRRRRRPTDRPTWGVRGKRERGELEWSWSTGLLLQELPNRKQTHKQRSARVVMVMKRRRGIDELESVRNLLRAEEN
jgi:hypothetical protein